MEDELMWGRFVCLLVLLGFVPPAAPGQVTASVIHKFSNFLIGAVPYTGVVRDSAGNLYGTTSIGGKDSMGVVFRVDTSGNQAVLHTFTGHADGGDPKAGLAIDSAGNLYGTASQHGANHGGVLFKITAAGHFSVLYSFSPGANGSGPETGVVLDGRGNIYGTVSSGGADGKGGVYKIDALSNETLLCSFSTTNGYSPVQATPVLDSSGNIYGMAYNGGPHDAGVIYEVSATGQYTILYSFTDSSDGHGPRFGVTLDAAGNLYGTAGGDKKHEGVVFKLDTAGNQTVLYSFPHDFFGPPTSGIILDSAGDLYFSRETYVYELDTSDHLTSYNIGAATDGKLIMDASGNIYGTTSDGGPAASGEVYQVTHAGAVSAIYAFVGGPDGVRPCSSLTLDASGNIYGTTQEGGVLNQGAVYKLDSSGNESILYSLNSGGLYAYRPPSPVVFDSVGNLYGTVTGDSSGVNFGSVYKVDASGNGTVLFTFSGGADGKYPNGVIVDSAGNLYGTTLGGGTGSCLGGCGFIYKLDPSGNQTILYSFQGTSMVFPNGLVLDAVGNLYGTTSYGGGQGQGCVSYAGCGVVFKLDPAGNYSVLYSFAGAPDAFSPAGQLIMDASGNLYGTAAGGSGSGCKYGCGTVYKVTPTGQETVLYSFTGNADGRGENPGLSFDAAGNLYGTTAEGGASNQGVVFELNTAGQETVLYNFGTSWPNPYAGVALDAAGNIYGAAPLSEFPGKGGVVYKLTGRP